MPLDKDPKILSLIQAVRTNKVLYDIRHENYLDADHTNRIWKGVALQSGYDNVAEAKKVWKDLNTHFMTCYRNKFIQNGNESGAKSYSNYWEYNSEMHFIVPYIVMNKVIEENVLNTSESKQAEKGSIPAITISSIRASAETQTPLENIRMDIPDISEENMTQNELCLRSYFDAIFRATCTLPLKWQNKVKRDMLQSLNSAEILADADRRSLLRAKQEKSLINNH